MNFEVKFFCLILIEFQSIFHISGLRELIQIQTLTRHGERSPCFSYPLDPYKHLWTKGLGQLTSKGLDQLKEAGSFLRSYYNKLLPVTFHKKEVYIKSSDTDRTIISALAAMSTLFENQLIPVHTVPKSYDFLLKMSSICPYHKKLLSKEFKLDKHQSHITKYNTFFNELEEGTGLQDIDIHMAFRVCDTITVWNQLNLTMPNWIQPHSLKHCLNLGHLKFIISYSDTKLTKFRGGPLSINIVNSMNKRARSFRIDRSGMKMIGFFSHDSTISALMSHVGSYNQLKPPLASILIFELYYDSEAPVIAESDLSQFFVRILFRNDTESEPHVLKIGICDNQVECRFDLFQHKLQELAFDDLPSECGLKNIMDYWFASNDKNKFYRDSLDISDGESKSSVLRKSTVDSDLLINILFPLLLVEIFVLVLFYRAFTR